VSWDAAGLRSGVKLGTSVIRKTRIRLDGGEITQFRWKVALRLGAVFGGGELCGASASHRWDTRSSEGKISGSP